jgi:hypothetical protein
MLFKELVDIYIINIVLILGLIKIKIINVYFVNLLGILSKLQMLKALVEMICKL